MPCNNSSCECGDECKCAPGSPGCDACAASMQSKGTKVFNLLVQITLTDCDAEKLFKDVFLPYAMWVNDNEPNTLMYTLMKSDKKPLFYNIIERYKDKERDFLGTHRSSAQFQEFRATLKALQDDGRAAVSGESFVDV